MAAQQPELEQRYVVSCLIFSAHAIPSVALFHRSDKVRTYRHQLAPISGNIESHEAPVEAAWRELKEETTLTPRDVELWRQGKPFLFSDRLIGRQWTIYPFAFRFKNYDNGGRGEGAIKIDWEHDGWGWYDPRDVKDGCVSGVPRLAESLRRVWFEAYMSEDASQALRSCLQQLKNDHQSGSHELTTIALTGFRDVLVHLRGDPNWWDTARMAVWHIYKNGRESMGAATLNSFLEVLGDLEEMAGDSLNNESTWDHILGVVDCHLENRQAMPSHIKDSFTAYLRDTFIPKAQSQSTLTILTLSASSTIRDSILDAFRTLPIPNLDLRILESRPLFEGASMASSLVSEFQTKFLSTEHHFKLTIYTDASTALAADGVDFLLLGADRISSEGWISNKIGSMPAVLSAKYTSPNVKVLVFSQLEKVAEPGSKETDRSENNDPVEVMTAWLNTGVSGVKVLGEHLYTNPDTTNCTVEVKNVYFEWVPAELINAYICEEGTLDLNAIKKKADQVKEKADKYLGSL